MQRADYASRTMPTLVAFLLFLLPCEAQAQSPSSRGAQEGAAPRLLDPTRDMLFITYERVEVWNEGEPVRPVRRVVLRLHNNSNCRIVLLTAELNDVAQPMPADASMIERAHPKLYEVIPDGHVVRGLRCYSERVSKPWVQKSLAGGDDFFEFGVPGGQTFEFSIPVEYFRRPTNIVVPFDFAWWQVDERPKWHTGGDVHQTVTFYSSHLPAGVVDE